MLQADWVQAVSAASQRLGPGSRRAQTASVLPSFARLPAPAEVLLAGWLAVRRELDCGEPMSDACRVGWAVVERLLVLGVYGDALRAAVSDPFDLVCLHLRGCAFADELEARHFMWRARLRPIRRRLRAARWRSPGVEQA